MIRSSESFAVTLEKERKYKGRVTNKKPLFITFVNEGQAPGKPPAGRETGILRGKKHERKRAKCDKLVAVRMAAEWASCWV